MDTMQKLIEWWERQAPTGLTKELELLAMLRNVAEAIRKDTIDSLAMSDSATEVALILLDDDGTRQVVEFLQCGHTALWTIPMIISASGFRQLLAIHVGKRASAPTLDSTTHCQQCADDFAYRMERLEYMMSL